MCVQKYLLYNFSFRIRFVFREVNVHAGSNLSFMRFWFIYFIFQTDRHAHTHVNVKTLQSECSFKIRIKFNLVPIKLLD